MLDFKNKKNIEVLVFMASTFCMSLILFFTQYSKWEKPVQLLNILGELTIIPTILLNLFLLVFLVFKLIKEKNYTLFLLLSLFINIITTVLIFTTK